MRDAMDTREGRGGKVVKCKGSFIQVLSRYQNIAPILDAILADPDESGQVCIVYMYRFPHYTDFMLATNHHLLRRRQQWVAEPRANWSRLPGTGGAERYPSCHGDFSYQGPLPRFVSHL